MFDRLERALVDKSAAKALWLGLRDPIYVQSIAANDVDVIVLDMQHGFHDERSIIEGILAVANAGKAPIVRIPVAAWGMAERIMDFGALGVIAPMINTVEDAKRFAEAMKYPPVGSRSFSPRHAASIYGVSVPDYLHQISDKSQALAMIETREAYENLDDILAVEGIDGILMGPADFSISITGNVVPDPYGEGTIKQITDIAERTRKAGKTAACFTMTPEHANLAHSLGYNLINVGLDQTYLDLGVKHHLDGLSF